MAINLRKGERANIGLNNLTVGLGWDINQSTGAKFDLDVSAFMLIAEGCLPSDEYGRILQPKKIP